MLLMKPQNPTFTVFDDCLQKGFLPRPDGAKVLSSFARVSGPLGRSDILFLLANIVTISKAPVTTSY